MSATLHISAKLNDEGKSCALTYSVPTDHSSRLTSTTELPKLIAHALQDLPFELLHDDHFLLPGEVHLLRQVGDRGHDRRLTPANRSLKLLFMACSPIGLEPERDFKKEEDAIYRATANLPIEILVEDSGSLEGLAEKLTTQNFDLIHISGHAALNDSGTPFFWMEDDEAGRNRFIRRRCGKPSASIRPTSCFSPAAKLGRSGPIPTAPPARLPNSWCMRAFRPSSVGEGRFTTSAPPSRPSIFISS